MIPIMIGPEIVKILGTEAYYQAIWVIPPVSLSTFFIFLYGIFGSIEFFYEKRSLTVIGSVIIALTNILLNAIFLPIIGFVAAGYTTLVCYVGYSIIHYLFVIRIMRDKENG